MPRKYTLLPYNNIRLLITKSFQFASIVRNYNSKGNYWRAKPGGSPFRKKRMRAQKRDGHCIFGQRKNTSLTKFLATRSKISFSPKNARLRARANNTGAALRDRPSPPGEQRNFRTDASALLYCRGKFSVHPLYIDAYRKRLLCGRAAGARSLRD